MLTTLPLVACTATPDAPITARAAANDLSSSAKLGFVAQGARRCWIARPGRFAGLALLDERDSRSQRLLIVDRSNPQGRPKLVIEIGAAGLVQTYGPLADNRTINQAQLFARSRGRRCI